MSRESWSILAPLTLRSTLGTATHDTVLLRLLGQPRPPYQTRNSTFTAPDYLDALLTVLTSGIQAGWLSLGATYAFTLVVSCLEIYSYLCNLTERTDRLIFTFAWLLPRHILTKIDLQLV